MTLSWGRLVAGFVLVTLGAAWVLAESGVVDVSAPVVLAALVLLVGLALVAAPRGAGRGGLVALGIVLVLAALAATLVDPRLLRGGVGERTETPREAAGLRDYRLAVGQLVIDLSELDPPARVEASVGVGELRVVVPRGGSVAVEAEVGAGEVDVRGERRSGVDVRATLGDDDGDLELDLRVGAGQIRVGGSELLP